MTYVQDCLLGDGLKVIAAVYLQLVNSPVTRAALGDRLTKGVMMKKRIPKNLMIGAMLGSLCFSTTGHTQRPPETPAEHLIDAQFKFSKALMQEALDSKDGAMKASFYLADCHGFQSELYAHLTRNVEISLKDIQMNESLASDSQRAGYAATFLIFNHMSKPDQHVNFISRDTRKQWKPKLESMGDKLSEAVWEKLLECKQVVPMSNYLFERGLKETR